MTQLSVKRPDETEYAPYYDRYISLVPEGDLLTTMAGHLEETLELLRGIPESRAGHRYAPGKWSVKEVVGHMIDADRVFGYRALWFARGAGAELPGFEQDDFIRNASFDDQTLEELATEYEHVRRSNLLLFEHLSGEAWDRRGKASDNEVSVRALAYILAGHELHHVNVLRTKYLQD